MEGRQGHPAQGEVPGEGCPRGARRGEGVGGSHDSLVRQPVQHQVEADGEPVGAAPCRSEQCPALASLRSLI